MEIIEMKVSPVSILGEDNQVRLPCPACGITIEDDPRWTEKGSMKNFIAHCPHCDGYVYNGQIISEETAYSIIDEAAK